MDLCESPYFPVHHRHLAAAKEEKDQTGQEGQTKVTKPPKPKVAKATKPKPRKPRIREPRVPTRTAEEQIQARRDYDKARSQTSERKEAARLHARQVLKEKKERGQCRDCPNEAITAR